jgi:hypothetical protein
LVPLGATNVNALASVTERPPDVTTTSPAPGVDAPPTTPIKTEELCRTTSVAATPPTVTVASAAKFAPLIEMFVPPVVLPCEGDIELTPSAVDGAVGDFEQELTPRLRTVSRKAY